MVEVELERADWWSRNGEGCGGRADWDSAVDSDELPILLLHSEHPHVCESYSAHVTYQRDRIKQAACVIWPNFKSHVCFIYMNPGP